MITGRHRISQGCASLFALALALTLLFSAGLPAPARAEAVDVDLILASNAAAAFGVKGSDGQLIVPRKEPGMKGRGNPDKPGEEPDYRGVVGYVSLQTGWEVSRFNTFEQTPWQLPVYEKDGDSWKTVDAIKHKTPVLVVDQEIREEKGKKYAGHLQVIRLDIHRMIWIDVKQFVTVPYWTLDLAEAVKYGYCIAVYRDKSRYEPMDRKGRRGTIPDGIRVLMCDKLSARYFSPDRKNNPLQGIVFRSKEAEEAYFRTFLFFNRDDLSLVY